MNKYAEALLVLAVLALGVWLGGVAKEYTVRAIDDALYGWSYHDPEFLIFDSEAQ